MDTHPDTRPETTPSTSDAPRHRRSRRRVTLALAATAVALVGYLSFTTPATNDGPHKPAVAAQQAVALAVQPVSPAPTLTPAPAPAPTPTAPATGTPAAQPGIPTRLEIPSVGIDARIVRTQTESGALAVPPPDVVGWEQTTRKPGAKQGATLMAGHRNWTGVPHAVLWEVPNLKRGDTIFVTTSKGRLTYKVTDKKVYPEKGGLPDSIVDPEGPHRLALVTCGDVNEDGRSRSFKGNVLVWATLA